MFFKYHWSQNREVNRPIADSLWPLEVVPRGLGQDPCQVLPRSEWSWSPSWLSTSWLSTSWSPSWLSTSSSLDIFGLPKSTSLRQRPSAWSTWRKRTTRSSPASFLWPTHTLSFTYSWLVMALGGVFYSIKKLILSLLDGTMALGGPRVI